MRCPTCGAPPANNEDRDWDQVTHSQWAAMFHAPELLAAISELVDAAVEVYDGRSSEFPALLAAAENACLAIDKAEGRGE
jgi:hypothetical protein